MSRRIATITVCVGAVATLGVAQGRSKGSEIATFSTLPALAGSTEALAIDAAGTVIAGYSWDSSGLLHAVEWRLQSDGSWDITDLPWPPGATSTIARGVNGFGAVGNDFPSTTSRAILWPATGGFNLLGCDTDLGPATVYGLSAGAQVVVGIAGQGTPTPTPSVWRPGSCREDLPGGSGIAFAVSADGTIVGGGASRSSTDHSAVPVRWTRVAGQWQREQLDHRQGAVRGANAAGDLAGYVVVPCALTDGCDQAVLWYATGSSRELGTLGGEQSWASDINASGEAVGGSTAHVVNTAYFWSESTGMVQLPFKGRWAAANSLSDVRSDGTRLVGMDSLGQAVVRVMRNP